MTTLQELFKKEEDKLRTALAANKGTGPAVGYLQEACERLLYAYNNESDVPDSAKSAAAIMLQSVRATLPLIDTNGDVRVWESAALTDSSAVDATDKKALKEIRRAKRRENAMLRRKKAASLFSVILLILGFAAIAAALFIVYYPQREILQQTSFTNVLIILILSGNFFFLSGILMIAGRSVATALTEQRTEVAVDVDKIISTFRTVILLIDRNLERISDEEDAAKRADGATGERISQDDTDLFSALLEAYYSGDGDYALDRLSDVKFHLHKMGVDVKDYSDETAADFDLMPGEEKRTIRPALYLDGKLLKKGQATA